MGNAAMVADITRIAAQPEQIVQIRSLRASHGPDQHRCMDGGTCCHYGINHRQTGKANAHDQMCASIHV
ncbi:hypothetical protein D3C84_1206810 [compost metagenome]